SADAYLTRGRQLYESNRDAARRDFDKALELDGEKPEVVLACAQVAVDASEWAKAEQLYRKAVEVAPDNILAKRGLAVALITVGRPEEGMKVLDDAIKETPSNIDLIMLRTDLDLRTKNLSGVEASIAELRELGLPRFFRDYLQGRLHEARGEWYQAVKKLDEARPHIQENRPPLLPQVDLLLARCHEQLGQHDLRLVSVQNALERDPSNVQFRWFKIQALLALKRIDEALAEYTGVEPHLSNLTRRSDQFLIQHLQLELLQQSRLNEQDRNLTDAERLVKRVIEAKRVDTAIKTTTLASYFELIGETERAEKLMDELRRSRADNPTMRLAQIKKRGMEPDGLEEAFAQLDEMQIQMGDVIPIRLLRAELLARMQPEGFEPQLQALSENTDAYDDATKYTLLTELGRYQLSLKNFPETLRLWKAAVEYSPDNVDMLMKIYDVSLLSEDNELIRKAANELKQLAGEDSPVWKWARAAQITLHVQKGKRPKSELVDAQGLIDESIKLRGGWEQSHRLKGEIALMQGRPDIATTAFQQALDLGSVNVIAHRQLARLYHQGQDYDSAARVLAKLPASAWTKSEQRIQLDIQGRKGELPEDLPYDTESEDVSDHLFIGQLLARAERFEEAEAALNRAIELEPKSATTWGALVQHHVIRGQPDKAEEMLRKGAENVPEDIRATFLASGYGLIKDWDQALQYYEEAMAAKPDQNNIRLGYANALMSSGQKDEAIGQLRQVIANDSGEFSSPEVVTARRSLADVIAANGTYESFREAMELLDENEERLGGLADEDLVLGAQIASRRVEYQTRKEALEKLELVRSRRKLSDGALLIMAQLYQGLDDWSATQSLMLDMLSRNPSNEALLDRWLTWLIAKGDMRQAAVWVEKADPSTPIYLRTKILIDADNGRMDRAIRRLQAVVPEQLDDSTLPNLAAVAKLAEELGAYDQRAYDEAEKMWKRYAGANRDAMLELAMHYQRRGDPAKAIDAFKVCQLAMNEGKGPAAIQVAINVLRAFRNDLDGPERYAKQVEKWIDTELAKDDSRGTLYIQRSELEDLLGNSDGAVEWMERFLAKDSVVPVQKAIVQNNLAFKLAFEGQTDRAEELLQEALKFFGPRPELRDTMGVIEYARGDYDQAVKTLQQAINEGQQGAATYLHLALALHKAGDSEAAAAALQSAEEADLSAEQLSSTEMQLHEQLAQDLKQEGLLQPEAQVPEVEQQAKTVSQ
ncbi:MAG: tetratricopeptide repeat protein, partial [Planctomycetota bacterium]